MLWITLAFAFGPTCSAAVAEVEGLDPTDPRFADTVLVVQKGDRKLGVYREGKLVEGACYPVALAMGYKAGHKQCRGDQRTPEGWQRISDRPWSSYYAALSVHYPDADDAARGLKEGLIDQAQHDEIVAADTKGSLPPRNTRLGGDIVIHGGGGGADWTLGCVGMYDEDIDALRTYLPDDKHGWVVILP